MTDTSSSLNIAIYGLSLRFLLTDLFVGVGNSDGLIFP